MLSPSRCFSREIRTTIKSLSLAGERPVLRCPEDRKRKGFRDMENVSWRRCSVGTNHISAFGVWRRGTRRFLRRINRRGETRWHRLPGRGHLFAFDRSRL